MLFTFFFFTFLQFNFSYRRKSLRHQQPTLCFNYHARIFNFHLYSVDPTGLQFRRSIFIWHFLIHICWNCHGHFSTFFSWPTKWFGITHYDRCLPIISWIFCYPYTSHFLDKYFSFEKHRLFCHTSTKPVGVTNRTSDFTALKISFYGHCQRYCVSRGLGRSAQCVLYFLITGNQFNLDKWQCELQRTGRRSSHYQWLLPHANYHWCHFIEW